jgi:hypothetical protein
MQEGIVIISSYTTISRASGTIRLMALVSWILAAAGALLAVRWWTGPVVLAGIPVNAPLNLEGVFGLLVTLLLARRSAAGTAPGAAGPCGAAAALAAAGVAVVALAPAAGLGFLSDDFILVPQAGAFSAKVFWTPGGDGFFRPLGYASLAATRALAGGDPRAWHWVALALHALNSALVALLAQRLGAERWVAAVAGILFALHGTHLEAVAWIAGRFDLLAATGALGAMLWFGRRTPAALLCSFAALWSKEAAFVLPGWLALIAWRERRRWSSLTPYVVLTAAAFLYRAALLGGIGGYRDADGQAAFFRLKPASTAKVLLARLWAPLYFPWNWSAEPGAFAALLCAAMILALLWLAGTSRPGPGFRVALAGLLLGVLPPLHLLGGAADLSGGRLLYLPSIFFCILLGFAAGGVEARRGVASAVVLAAFHFVAVRHNLSFWEEASRQVAAICAAPEPPPELPRSIHGVPALANGYPECRR